MTAGTREDPDGRPSLRERSRLRARREIGLAARRLFLTEGYSTVSVERVAEEAGVSVRTVFRHFPHKEDLLFFEHADVVARLSAMLDEAPAGRPSLDVIAESLARVVRLGESPPEEPVAFVRLMETEPDLHRHAEHLTADHGVVIEAFLRRRLGDGPGAGSRAAMLAGAVMGVMGAARRQVHLAPEPPGRALRRGGGPAEGAALPLGGRFSVEAPGT